MLVSSTFLLLKFLEPPFIASISVHVWNWFQPAMVKPHPIWLQTMEYVLHSSHLAEAVVCNMVAGWLFVWKSLSTRDTEIVLKGGLVPETLGHLCCKTSGQCSSVDRCDPWPKEQCQQQLPVQEQHLYQSDRLKVEWYWDTILISLYFVLSDE